MNRSRGILCITFLFGLLFSGSEIFSQSSKRIEDTGFLSTSRGTGDGNIVLKHDSRVFSIIDKHISTNENKFPGWRVQIFFGSGASSAGDSERVKNAFINAYGLDIGCYIVYEAPYYKVKAGDFRTRAEALKFKEKITKDFSNSWIVEDMITYPNE